MTVQLAHPLDSEQLCMVGQCITSLHYQPPFHDEAARSRSWCVGKENKPGMLGRSTIGIPGFCRLPDPMPITGRVG